MAKTRNRRTAGDTASHCVDGTRRDEERRDLGKTMPIRPRVNDASRASSLDGSRDGPLRDLDMTVLDWSILRRIGLKNAHDDCERDGYEDLLVSVDLKAVRRLGTILKRLSARSRARRRLIN